MLKNYILSALRNMFRHSLYSLINIGGLALGLTACLLILLFVRDELSYDTWLPGVDSLFRIEITFYPPGRPPIGGVQMPGPAPEAMKRWYGDSEIEDVTRIFRDGVTITIDGEHYDDTMTYADASFFNLFDLPAVAGDRQQAMKDNSSVLLTEETAQKYFGDSDPIGRVLTIDDGNLTFDLKVVGILKDIPENSHLEMNFLALFDPARYVERPWVAENWTSSNMYGYVKLPPGVPVERVTSRLEDFLDANMVLDFPGLENISPSTVADLHLLPVRDIHLRSVRPGGMKPDGDIRTVYTFAGVALLILLIASINFMNLATARSLQRAREVSMRKVVGAARRQLVGQFLGESILTTVLALTIAVVTAWLVMPWYNQFLGKSLRLDFFHDPGVPAMILALAVVVGFFGGIYPAFVLSSFRPAHVLQANPSGASGSLVFRNILVTAQFAISIGLVVATAIVYYQTQYARTKDLGYDRQHKLVISGLMNSEAADKAQSFSDEVQKIPGVQGATFSSDSFPQTSDNNTLVDLPGFPSQNLLVLETLVVGQNFFQFYGVKPLAGRLFSKDFPSDVRSPLPKPGSGGVVTRGVILNERALKLIGIPSPQDAVGQQINEATQDNDGNRFDVHATIVGVVPDLHTRSLKVEITPMIFYTYDKPQGVLTLDLRSDNLPDTLARIDGLWQSMVPGQPISRRFVDESFQALYTAEEERAQMFAYFSLFAIAIACLGLFGLASYAAELRTREIGIRKVMGASVVDIVRLLVWQFSKPVLVANLIAWPVAWYLMSDWLSKYPYRMDLGPGLFIAAGLVALAIAWVTVGGQAFFAARENPANVLSYE